MKYLIVGLGNPGDKYQNTRHNIGFKVVEEFVRKHEGTPLATDRLAMMSKAKFKGRTIILIQPTTYMNLSGKALNYWMKEEKIPIERVLVITDDISLPFGTLRLKGKGSDGGHNGLKDIQDVLGNNKYPRLRFGIGNDFFPGKQSDYVLGEWNSDENKKLEERIEQSVKIIEGFCSIGLQLTMSNYNGK